MAEREEQTDNEELEFGGHALWSGTISFGLVSIPVDLYAANRPRKSMRMLGPDGAPLRRVYFCPEDDEPVPSEDLVRGYEVERGKFVVVTDEELEALEPKKSRDIDLQQFVPRDQLPPLLFERGYFLAPAGTSTKAYRLLAETMEQTERAGIATFVMRDRSYVVAIVARDGVLRAETLRYANEVRSIEDIGLDVLPKPKPALVKKIRAQIAKLKTDQISLEELQDQHTAQLRELAERKLERETDVVQLADEERSGTSGASVVDLMQVLREKLGVEAEPADEAAAAEPEQEQPKKKRRRAASK